ncbi:MAG: repair protein RecO protein [Candidatus Magasanikbacteria bacterium GW2011_GWA2_45_39]|uniref:DNA repair protein RecO n=2 Tax=Candidatus Magasanikiibacteriota TaxID=1752731 RepID=A0A0G1MWE3_9BACT|nr:MAG: repair protein RecO protein [Candidatus Magasanikbacteria bacterium GW2011_GWA2_45_39]KKU12611.1 MAG: repair protein RecO protein [Candidatus Magasanikbacteria bacterium GW2011_GWC2_45_8]HBW73660.1 DNA repair protein RecO [Candidatus Magasanikbacteria bacterium]
MTITTQAFIIKRRTYREYDKVVTLYTPQFGKIEAVAIGTKKPLSKLAGQLEPLQQVCVQLTRGKGLSRIAQVVGGSHFFQKFGNDLTSIVWAQKTLALIDRLVPWKESQSGVYDRLEKYFALLLFAHEESASGAMAPVLTIGFGWQMAGLLGYKPVMTMCVACGVKIGRFGAHFFDIAGGGLCCAKCVGAKEKPPTGMELAQTAKQYLADIVAKPLDFLLEYTSTDEDFKTIQSLFDLFVRYHFPTYAHQRS